MSNRFAEAIKRIVEPLIPPKSKGESQKDKPSIPGDRAISYQVPDGSTGVAQGTPGVSQAPGTATGTGGILSGSGSTAGDAATSAREGAAYGSNQNDPTNSISGHTQGVYNADDALGGDGPDKSESESSSTSGTVSYGASTGQKLLGLTGLVDCDTSDPMSIRFDGYYVPPASWETADSPAAVDTESVEYGGISFNDVGGACQLDQCGASFQIVSNGGGSYRSEQLVSEYRGASFNELGATWTYDASQCEDAHYISACGSRKWMYRTAWGTTVCKAGYSFDGTSCVLTDSTAAKWPTSGTFQLSYQSGSWVPSSRDTEVPANYSTPSSILRACTEGGATIEITPLKNGGFAFYELVAGVPSGVIQIYRSDNTLAGYTDTAGLAMLIP